jgi:glucosylglycerol-phosphate synthase
MKKSSLVIVYHRQPYQEVEVDGRIEYREHASPNGIVPTLKSFFGAVDQGAWVAWKQAEPAEQDSFEPVIEIRDSYGSYNVTRLPLTAQQVSSFYHVTSKEALWPILHSFPERYNYDSVDWPVFREVNRLFAEAAMAAAAEGAVVWIHDYNLWLAPAYIKRLRPDLRVAFFHHTPFPAPGMFNILPWREEIIDSLLSCDVIGFHIPRYAVGFVATARSLRGVEILEEVPVEDSLSPCGLALSEPTVPTRLSYQGREIGIDAFPVGVNAAYIREVALSEATRQREARLKSDLGDRRFIVSIGRTDYTKGTRDMLLAFERLLERRPEVGEQLQLLVTSVSANAGMDIYRNVQHEIEQIAGRINGRYGTLSWQPLLLMTSAIPFEELIAYYRCADLCWVTPLRDGLNLVAKEYVAARHDLGGALVLSEFTGASVELGSAILANPYSSHSMDAAIDRALDMPRPEQLARMARMWKSVQKYDSSHWAGHTLQRFAELPGQLSPTRRVSAVPSSRNR